MFQCRGLDAYFNIGRFFRGLDRVIERTVGTAAGHPSSLLLKPSRKSVETAEEMTLMFPRLLSSSVVRRRLLK